MRSLLRSMISDISGECFYLKHQTGKFLFEIQKNVCVNCDLPVNLVNPKERTLGTKL